MEQSVLQDKFEKYAVPDECEECSAGSAAGAQPSTGLRKNMRSCLTWNKLLRMKHLLLHILYFLFHHRECVTAMCLKYKVK